MVLALPGWLDALLAPRRAPPRVVLVLDDIAVQDVDVVVNAADQTLLGGTGVDGAIHAAAGPGLGAACRALGGCGVGQAKMTPGFGLRARHVLHAVAPVWDHGGHEGVDGANREVLEACFAICLLEADRAGARSIAFPSLGAGAFGWAVDDVAACARAALKRVSRRLRRLDEVRFVAFDRPALRAWERAFGTTGRVATAPERLRYHPGHAASQSPPTP